MKNSFAKKVLIGIFSIALLLQVLLFMGVIPYEYTWGGRLESQSQARVFVFIGFSINALFLWATLVKAQYLNSAVSTKVINAIFWLMVFVFALNTLGNMMAKTNMERYLATPATLVLTILCFIIVREK